MPSLTKWTYLPTDSVSISVETRMKRHPLQPTACFQQWQIWDMTTGRTRGGSDCCCLQRLSRGTILFCGADLHSISSWAFPHISHFTFSSKHAVIFRARLWKIQHVHNPSLLECTISVSSWTLYTLRSPSSSREGGI